MFKYITVTLLFLYGIDSQVIRQGTCPDASVQENFELSRFAGVWYEAEKYPVEFEKGGSCVYHDLTQVSDSELSVRIVQLLRASGQTTVINGTAKLAGNLDEAKFVVRLQVGPDPQDTPYWAIETDYDSYVVVWSCSQVDASTTAELSYILTRERNPSSALLEKAYNVYDNQNLSRNELEKADQNNC